jgi:hypothetical protein
MTYQELYTAVKEKKIVSASNKDKKYRLFVATNGQLCYFIPRSSRRGWYFTEELFNTVDKFQEAPGPKTQDEKFKKQYNTIAKYKKLAQQATFSNSFIEDCKRIPEFNEWINDKVKSSYDETAEPRPKGLYELGITTGNKIDGKVVSLSRIAKQYPHYIARLREAIKTQTESSICHAVPFAGYDMSLSTAKKETGEFIGYLSLEYKGCGNGYYYLLINDENFIGYDVD